MRVLPHCKSGVRAFTRLCKPNLVQRGLEARALGTPSTMECSIMFISELSGDECVDLLIRVNFGRLACAKTDQPYITPISFAYKNRKIHCASTVGQKIEWMRTNPLVCLQVDEVTSPHIWVSVVVFGRYHELPDTPEHKDMRFDAWSALQRRPVWWEPAYVKTVLGAEERPLTPLFFDINIERITGRRGSV